MRKFTEMAQSGGLDVKRALTSGVLGAAALCLSCLIFSFLILYDVLPFKFIVAYASLSGFLGGLTAAVVLGAKGKILFYVPVTFCIIMAIIFAMGTAIFDTGISLTANPFMPISVLFGLSLGSFAVNSR